MGTSACMHGNYTFELVNALSDLEETAAEELFKMIVAHWITLRGFSFAGALLEKYKQLNKKNVQKSKGVRKQLQSIN